MRTQKEDNLAGFRVDDPSVGSVRRKRYGLAPRLLERNRVILKDYYYLIDKKRLTKRTTSISLSEKYKLSAHQIRNILLKMRNREKR
jgi:hypothetical protein